ncbi:MAG: phospho-N-acetylmuramoyl-pentapeptide-transferase [Eubacteriales bacterium]|nr:phospho-N-acetylmuramoyl-pentapeptide-transferase [Eubacteriales bacterium]
MFIKLTIICIIILILSLLIYPKIIPFFYNIKFGQTEREVGPKTHYKKQGTPTMGGIVFSLIICIMCLFLSKGNKEIIIISFTIFAYMLLGFFDDYEKVVKKNTRGLAASPKFILQTLIASLFFYITFVLFGFSREIIIPFYKNTIELGNIFFIFIIFLIVGTNNATNFTDGLDGLLSIITIIISFFFISISIKQNNNLYIVPIIVISSLFGFLIFNHFPAKIFMGDTGSLAIGGYIASMSIFLKIELLLPIFGFVYMAEVLSVIIQVSYFKITHGKRVFKMAPIHHHFELCGYNEKQIVFGFSLLTIILCIISYYSII